MEINSLLPLALIIISSWLLALSVLVYWHVLRGKKKPTLSGEEQIIEAISKLKEGYDKSTNNLAKLESDLEELIQKSAFFIQKVGFTRFNPFEETGGDQSFSVALLDKNNDGFVLTSLHTRSGTRTYAKQIIDGKNKQEFSKEEQKVIKIAMEKELEK